MPTSPDYHYRIDLPNGRHLAFAVHLDRKPDPTDAEPPAWCRLRHHQCPNCQLDPFSARHCPTALALVDIVDACQRLESIAQVQVTVESARRTVKHTTDMQTALRSLIGLVMPTSGCPVLGRLAGLARFHLPFADRDETVFRVVGAHLLEQYLGGQGGRPARLGPARRARALR